MTFSLYQKKGYGCLLAAEAAEDATYSRVTSSTKAAKEPGSLQEHREYVVQGSSPALTD